MEKLKLFGRAVLDAIGLVILLAIMYVLLVLLQATLGVTPR